MKFEWDLVTQDELKAVAVATKNRKRLYTPTSIRGGHKIMKRQGYG